MLLRLGTPVANRYRNEAKLHSDSTSDVQTKLKDAAMPPGWPVAAGVQAPSIDPPLSEDQLDITAGDLVESKPDSLDMCRVVSVETPSVNSSQPEITAAAPNVCPMSPQISMHGQYRFVTSDSQSKDGSASRHGSQTNNSLFKEDSSPTDNPFSFAHGPRTLAEYLTPHRVEFSEIEKEYKPHMRMMAIVFGNVPSYLRYLAICDSSHKAFELILPNFLSVSKLLGGMGAPKNLISLAMIASSKSAGAFLPFLCVYCICCVYVVLLMCVCVYPGGPRYTPLHSSSFCFCGHAIKVERLKFVYS